MNAIEKCIEKYPILSYCKDEISAAVKAICKGYENKGKLLVCGNGGSAADSGHIAGELMKGFNKLRPLPENEIETLSANYGEYGETLGKSLQGGLPVIALPDQTALFTAFCNDVDPNSVYAQMTYAYAQNNDVFIGISTSGNSDNIIKAAMVARLKGATTIALVGENKCKLDNYCDIVIHAPGKTTPDIQELHLPIYHAICSEIEDYFFQE